MGLTAIAVAAGVVVGLLLGALGGGGSILAVPVLVYLLGQSPHQATTGSLVIVGLGALSGLLPHLRAGQVRLGQGVLFGVVGVGGSYLGTRLASGLDGNLLLALFSGLLLVVAGLMFRKNLRPAGTAAPPHQMASPPHRSSGRRGVPNLRLELTATGVGLLTGFFGVGGGFAVVPALTLALGFEMATAVGTSLVVIAINSLIAFLFHAGGDMPDWGVVAPFAGAAVVGSVLGGLVAQRLPKRTLGLSFASLLVLVAIYTAVRSVSALS